MKLKVSFLILSLGFINALHAQNEFNIYGNLKFGSNKVGVKQMLLPETSNKVRMTMWYPSKGKQVPLRFSNYLDFNNELSSADLLHDISIGMTGQTGLIANDTLQLLLNAKVKATKNARAIQRPFPLLIWSDRNGTVEYQNMTSEYLASHGYVVVYAEDVPNSPYPWQIQSSEEKEKTLNQHLKNINTSINYLQRQAYINPNKIGLLSWSYGGESAVLAQMRNSDIDFVIGLSAIGFSSGIYLGQEFGNRVDPAKLNVPYLMLFEKVAPNGNQRTLPSIINSMHPNSRYVSLEEISHGNFNVLEGMFPGIIGTDKVQSWSTGGKVAQTGYETICQLALFFANDVFYGNEFDSFDKKSKLLKGNRGIEFISISAPEKD